MGTSPAPGNTSFNTGISEEKLLLSLEQSANSLGLQTVQNILGVESQLHIVGGTLREEALGKHETDVDLATRFPPEEVISKLTASGLRVIETGVAHGTVLVLVGEEQFEITTFRTPGPRNKAVYSSSIEEDLAGRDFTVNALAYNLFSRVLLDPYDGIADLQNSLIRCVGVAEERFKEDPLRMLRMIRFGPAQGFSIYPETSNAAIGLASTLKSVSTERIRQELEKILTAPEVACALRAMKDLHLLPLVLPEILPTIGFEQNEFHIHDVFEHTLWVLERANPDLLIRLAALFHDLGKPHTLSIDDNGRRHFYKHELVSEEICTRAMERLLFPKRLTRDVALLVRNHMRPLDCGPAAVRRLIRDLGPLFNDWIQLKCADAPPTMSDSEFTALLGEFKRLKSCEDERQLKQIRSGLCISGDDLIALGFRPGPALGTLLQQLEEHILETPEDNSRERIEFLLRTKFSDDVPPGTT